MCKSFVSPSHSIISYSDRMSSCVGNSSSLGFGKSLCAQDQGTEICFRFSGKHLVPLVITCLTVDVLCKLPVLSFKDEDCHEVLLAAAFSLLEQHLLLELKNIPQYHDYK